MNPHMTLSADADLANLAPLCEAIERFCEDLGQPPAFAMAVVLSVDEAATNSILHGYRGSSGQVTLELTADDGVLTVRLRDTAPTFDPTSVPAPDITASLEDRPIGGLGIHLMRANMDSLTHSIPAGGGNELTMTKRLTVPAGG